MEYICDEIIHVTKYEKIHLYFKTRTVNGTFFVVNDIDIHQLNLGLFRILEFLVEKICFLHLFNNKCIIMFFFGEKKYHVKEEEVLYVGFALFLVFFYLIMFHEPQA